METAIVNEANSPTRGSTPAMIENEIASGISARATTRPARTSVRSILGDRSAFRTVGCSDGAVVLTGVVVSDRAAAHCGSARQRVRESGRHAAAPGVWPDSTLT